MKRLIIGIVVAGVLLTAIWLLSTILAKNETNYGGAPLKIAVLGDTPVLENKKIHFEIITLEKLSQNTSDISANFDALMITPKYLKQLQTINL